MERTTEGLHTSTLGELIRGLRQRRRWTQRQLSELTGIPLSTLAKVEKDIVSLTYERLRQLTSRLGLTMAEFVGQEVKPTAVPPRIMARRSLSSEEDSDIVSTPSHDYRFLFANLRHKRMVPILASVRDQSLEQSGLTRHAGEEFVYVLEGTVEVHLQFYTPVLLKAGQAIYLDATMEHAYLAKECDSALILVVCVSDDPEIEAQPATLHAG